MATEEDVQQAILDRIAELVPHAKDGFHAEMVRNLAEAYAWITAPAQPHGGSASG